ncbi:MAG TPA: hypothetical protein VF316_01130, partial [Polyangiaceae bacterium]
AAGSPVDDVLRNRRVLLTRWALALPILAVAACSPARQQPVGASQGGAESSLRAPGPPPAPPLAGLPPEFRTSWTPLGAARRSEHGGGRFEALVFANAEGASAWIKGGEPTVGSIFVDELLDTATDGGKTTAGIYLIERREGGYRFAAADGTGRTLTDAADDAGAGTTAALCIRCHAESMRRPLFPLQ